MARRVVVLEQGALPSTDYLLLPWLRSTGATVLRADVRDAPPFLLEGDFVVVVRLLDRACARAIDEARSRLAGLAWFVDDDLLDHAALKGLERRYRARVIRGATQRQRWFAARGAELWVSTPALAVKYAERTPRLVELRASAPMLARRPAPIKVAYHGTSSHMGEMQWLRGVMAPLLARHDNLFFEVFGDIEVNRVFRGLPRMIVLHAMPWPTYLAYTATHHADIGLAPLLPGAFNASRGAVKFHDYTRLGAAGLYADVPPYRGMVRDGIDGALLPMDAAVWTAAIQGLIADPDRRRALAHTARDRLAAELLPPEAGAESGI